MRKVTIIDYGLGNLLSVKRAFEYIGAQVEIAESPKMVEQAERLVLPGVGSFERGLQGLSRRNLIDSIIAYAESGKPLLGICLGMQMLMERGFENGLHTGLGLILGEVVPIPPINQSNHQIRHIPHMGWNHLNPAAIPWKGTILNNIEPDSPVYFVHSYMTVPVADNDTLATCRYDDETIIAAMRKDNISGCQFHPEKSGSVGLMMLDNFISL
ncbi:MAG: imidazole glycerol phosphate synthase subunit HisH [Methylocystaceae bacterium]